MQANELARSWLSIELPVARNARSRLAAQSLQESYLALHKELISSKLFLKHLVTRAQNDNKINSLVSSSLADGPLPLVEILMQRLDFRLEKTEGRGIPALLLEGSAETLEEAKTLVQLTQAEYFRFLASNKKQHPKILWLASKLKEAQQTSDDCESDLAAYQRLNKQSILNNPEGELLSQLASCRTEKRRLAEDLREITRAYAANPGDIETLASLGSLARFDTIGLMNEKLSQLEKLARKYKQENNPRNLPKIQKVESTIKMLSAQVPIEVNRAISNLKGKLHNVLEQELKLTERLVGSQKKLAELAMNYPQAAKLQIARQSVANLELQMKQLVSKWEQACKYLKF